MSHRETPQDLALNIGDTIQHVDNSVDRPPFTTCLFASEDGDNATCTYDFNGLACGNK